jgi:AraC-like DNA-binding protein
MTNALQGDGPATPFLWTRGVAARETLSYLDRHGIDAEPMLSKAELSRAQLTQDSGGISVASQHRFLELAAAETNDSLLGLHVAAEMDMRNIGILFYLGASSVTVADALERVARYGATTNEQIRVEISRRKEDSLLTLHRVPTPNEPHGQHSEFVALAFDRVLCRLTNRDFAPLHITFAHARNSAVREVHRILRCPVEFAQATTSWVLPQRVMELRIVSEDSHLLQILEAHAEDLLSARRSASGLRGLLEERLVGVLPSGKIQAAEVAKQLGLSARSFRRYLAEEGTSYGEVLERLRRRLAARYLQDEQVSLQQIAWLLGYSEIGAFNHAFKRWTGTSPGRARNLPDSLATLSA